MADTPIGATVTPITANTFQGPWKLEYRGYSAVQKDSFPIINLPTDTGPYAITFTIGGQNNLTFDPARPILIDGAPPTTGGQIQVLSLSQGGKALAVRDLNNNDAAKGPLDLNYSLNFVGGDQQHRTLDPVIKNGGKTTVRMMTNQPSFLEVGTFVISAAVLITLLFVAYQILMLRRDLARK